MAQNKVNNNFFIFDELKNPNCRFIERAQLFNKLNFHSIIRPIDIIKPETENDFGIIILPFTLNGNLDSLIQNISIEYTNKCIILYGIAMGMLKLHDQDIAHKNLFPSNILINNEFEPWISGFITPYSQAYYDISYVSPEVLSLNSNKKVNFDERFSDIYSFGMIAYYLFTGIKPWNNIKNNFTIFQKVIKGERPKIPNDIEQPIINLITQCWESSPEMRPTFRQICEKISDVKFYSNSNNSFNSKKFYEYQIKLGELHFIKFSKNEIKKFYDDSTNSDFTIKNTNSPEINSTNKKRKRDVLAKNYRKALRIENKDVNQLYDYFDILEYFQTILDNKKPTDKSCLIPAEKIEELYKNNLFTSDDFSSIIESFENITLEINYPSNFFIQIISIIKEKNNKKINVIVIISNVLHFLNLPKIKYSAFSVVIRPNVKSIGPFAFKECNSLKQIEIPSSVLTIGRNAFENCTSLTQINLPDSLIKIGEDIFKGCNSLKNVSMSASIKNYFISNKKDTNIPNTKK